MSEPRKRLTEFQSWLAAYAIAAGFCILLWNYPDLLIGSALIYGGFEAFRNFDPPKEEAKDQSASQSEGR